MYCCLSMKINTCETPHGEWRSCTDFVCVCFCAYGRQKPEYPQLELHGWRHHYTGWYRSSGISFISQWKIPISITIPFSSHNSGLYSLTVGGITCFGFSGNELSSGHTLLLSSILLSITPLVPFSTSGVQSGQRTSLPLYVTFSPGAIVTLSKNQKKSCVNSYHYYVLYQNFFLNSTS